MQPVSDNTLLHQLRNEDSASFAILYKFYFPSISAYIINNEGSKEDAEDIFQESIVVLLLRIRGEDFVLTSSLKTYLFAIARNCWLKRLRDNKRLPVDYTGSTGGESFTFELLPEPTTAEKVTSWLGKITEHCQRILKAIFFYKEPMESLMRKMGWKNKHTAANQQYKCIQQIKKHSSPG